MVDLKNEIAKTKSIKELSEVFNNASNEILENISNKKYSDVVKHIDNLMMNLVNVIKEGNLSWYISNEESFSEKDKKNSSYYVINFPMRRDLTVSLNEYAMNKLNNKLVEFTNFRDALIRTVTEYAKSYTTEEPSNLMAEKIGFITYNAPKKLNPLIKGYESTPSPPPTEKLQTNIDSESELQKEISKTKSMEDLISILNKELDKTLPEIGNKKYSDVVKNIDHLVMNLVHAMQEGNLSWHYDNGKFSWLQHNSSYNNLSTKFRSDIAVGVYAHVEKELKNNNKFIELENFRSAVISTVTEYDKVSKYLVSDNLMSKKFGLYEKNESTTNTQERLQATLEKVRSNNNEKGNNNTFKNS